MKFTEDQIKLVSGFAVQGMNAREIAKRAKLGIDIVNAILGKNRIVNDAASIAALILNRFRGKGAR